MATGNEFDALLMEAGHTPMRGQEYDYGRRICLEPSLWDFPGRMLEYYQAVASLLDMGTGGGEWLGRLPYRPSLIVATEGWTLNPEVVWGHLEPPGIRVVEVEGVSDNHRQGREGDGGGALSFADGTFDLVGNRHESHLPSEVRRVPVPGGCLLTQQVAGDSSREFYAPLGESAPTSEAPRWNLGFARAQLEAAELPPMADGEGWEVLHLTDAGALAWYLLNLPWVSPGFSFRRYRRRLRGLHESGKPLAVRQLLFWLEACNPQAACGQRKSRFISSIRLRAPALRNRLSRWVFIVGRLSPRH